jgi:hypothetical protein
MSNLELELPDSEDLEKQAKVTLTRDECIEVIDTMLQKYGYELLDDYFNQDRIANLVVLQIYEYKRYGTGANLIHEFKRS